MLMQNFGGQTRNVCVISCVGRVSVVVVECNCSVSSNRSVSNGRIVSNVSSGVSDISSVSNVSIVCNSKKKIILKKGMLMEMWEWRMKSVFLPP